MDSKTRRFDKQLLDKTLADANATLQGEYPELKYNSVIVYSCNIMVGLIVKIV
jgi:hypothetical protein